jgi:serine protease Do
MTLHSHSKGSLSTIVSGAIGAVLAVALLIAWASNHPAEVSRLLNFSSGNRSNASLPSNANNNPEFRAHSTQEAQVTDVVKNTNPAVVSIVITKDVPIIERYEVPSDPFSDFFNPFNLRTPQLRQKGTEKREVGGGSGFFVSADGLIITNRHVVSEEGVEYTVFTNDGTKYNARIIARDPSNDIAVLKIDGSNFPFLELGSSDQLQVGQTVIAIGNALGEFRNTVSVGVVSGLSRSIVAGSGFGQSEQLEGVIQTDAAINPGNSGGPLLDLEGKVIGVNVAVAQGSQSIGFALPVNIVRSVVDSVQKTGRVIRPFLGIRYTLITPTIKQQNSLSVDSGALISRGETTTELAVVPGSAADKAGLQEGDIILEIDGKPINAQQSISAIVAQKQVGDTIHLKVLSKGQTKDVPVTLQEVPQ